MYVISAQFSLQRTMDDYMETSTWRSCATYLERIASVVTDGGYKLGVETIDEADMILGGTASTDDDNFRWVPSQTRYGTHPKSHYFMSQEQMISVGPVVPIEWFCSTCFWSCLWFFLPRETKKFFLGRIFT